jgi:uncharacterized membrane protein YkoI
MKSSLAFVALLGMSMVGCMAEHKDHHENMDDHEVKVPFEQVPAPAQATLMKESAGATITTVDMEKDDGITVYEAEAMIGGTNYEIKVDVSGKLISKKIDKEEDEQGEHGEKDEKGNKD